MTSDASLLDASVLLAKARRENFPVALRFAPRRLRGHLLAVYGFARLVDDTGDEATGDRLAMLDAIERDLRGVLAGDAASHPLVGRAATCVRACQLDPALLVDLIDANRCDQSKTRYATYEELVAYCRLSAVPVGRLVLGIVGAADEERTALSDRICTGLQIVEHCQDVAEDARRGRVYLPQEDLHRFGVAEAELQAPAPASEALRGLVRFEVRRARELLTSGAPLVRSVHGFARLAVAGFVGGGQAAADAIGRAGFDVLAAAPTAPRRARLAASLRLLGGR